jgi:hypothetical protein
MTARFWQLEFRIWILRVVIKFGFKRIKLHVFESAKVYFDATLLMASSALTATGVLFYTLSILPGPAFGA